MELETLQVILYSYAALTTMLLGYWFISSREAGLKEKLATMEEEYEKQLDDLQDKSEKDLELQQDKYEKQIEKMLDKHTKEIDKLESDISKRITEQEHKLVVEKMKNEQSLNELETEYKLKISDAINSSADAIKKAQIDTEKVKNQLYDSFYTKSEQTNQAYQLLYKEIISNNHSKLNVHWDSSNPVPTTEKGR